MKTIRKIAALIMAAVLLAVMPACSGPGADSSGSAEKNGEVYILFTSDVHCGMDQGFGYAGLQQVKETLESQG